jgi:hypothetical protein
MEKREAIKTGIKNTKRTLTKNERRKKSILNK